MIKKWRLWRFFVILALVLALAIPIGGQVIAAPTCTITVHIPIDLAATGAKVSVYPWNSSYTDLQTFAANQGSNVQWRIVEGPFTGKTFNFPVPAADTADLTVGSDAYCVMQVINVPDGGKIYYYPWNNYWVNNQQVPLPIGSTITWKLKLNGFDGQQYTKVVDCTPLDAKQAWIYVGNSSCNMKVQMAQDLINANAQVNVYPWNTYWSNNEVINVPIGGSFKWKLIVNGFAGSEYIKAIDCSPLVVNTNYYYMMQVENVPVGMKVNVYPWNTYWDNTTLIAVPLGGKCTWKLTGPGAPTTQYTKNFNGNPLDVNNPAN